MCDLIPKTLNDLKRAHESCNPVVIAGYSRESTHKGYLSWMLDSRRNKVNAMDITRKLLSAAEIDIDFKSVHVAPEAKTKTCNSKIDLVLRLDPSAKGECSEEIPVELKVESGPSGNKQLQNLNNQPSIVLLLGSSSTRDFDWERYSNIKVVRHSQLLELWKTFCNAGPLFLCHWLESVAMEVARKRLAHELYQRIIEKPTPRGQATLDELHSYGFCSDKHLWYYIYDAFRNVQEPFKKWQIADGSYNPVLSGPSKSLPLETGVQEAYKWYFEFNYGVLRLKLSKPEGDPYTLEKLKDWRKRLVEQANDPSNEKLPAAKPSSYNKWSKKWLTMVKWDLRNPSMDFERTAETTSNIIDRYQQSRMMG